MKKYKYIFLSILFYLFGYSLIFLSNATLAFQSYFLTALVVSLLYSLVGYFWKKSYNYLIIPIIIHSLLILSMFLLQPKDFSIDFKILSIIFLLPLFCLLMVHFIKNNKYGFIYLLDLIGSINFISFLISYYNFNINATLTKEDIKIDNLSYIIKTNLISFKDSSIFNLNIDNKIVVIDFWYSSCSPCKEMMPFYENLYESYKNDTSVILISVNSGNIDSYRKAINLLNKENKNKQYFYYDKEGILTKKIKVSGYPELIILSKEDTIFYRKLGFNFDESLVFQYKLRDIIESIKHVKI